MATALGAIKVTMSMSFLRRRSRLRTGFKVGDAVRTVTQ